MLTVCRFEEEIEPDLHIFLEKCKELNYINNSSVDRLKLYEWTDTYAQFWVIWLDKKIVAISGCHKLEDLGNNYCRIGFRTCQLPYISNYYKKTKYNFHSPIWYHIIPLQIEWALQKNLENCVISINSVENEYFGKIAAKTMSKLEKFDIVSLEQEVMLYKKLQKIYKININNFFKFYNKTKVIKNEKYITI